MQGKCKVTEKMAETRQKLVHLKDIEHSALSANLLCITEEPTALQSPLAHWRKNNHNISDKYGRLAVYALPEPWVWCGRRSLRVGDPDQHSTDLNPWTCQVEPWYLWRSCGRSPFGRFIITKQAVHLSMHTGSWRDHSEQTLI